MNNESVLIVEDEEDIRELIHFNLYKSKYRIFEAKDGEEAFLIAKKEQLDLILLDIMIPKIDGLSLLAKLKETVNTKHIPVILVSAKGEESDIVAGLDAGADDYISKPFSPKVLIARVRSLSRRKQTTKEHKLLHGIKIDIQKHKVFIDSEEITLTYSEYQLLELFYNNPGRVFTRTQIVDHVKGENRAVTNRSVDTQIVSLRKKLKNKGEIIETVWGVGYRFKEDEN